MLVLLVAAGWLMLGSGLASSQNLPENPSAGAVAEEAAARRAVAEAATPGKTAGSAARGVPGRQDAAREGRRAERASASSESIFYTTWWFLALCVGAGMGAIGLLHWMRVRGLKGQIEARTEKMRSAQRRAEAAVEQADRLKELSDAKSRVLTELSHSFRTPLTLTLGPIDNLLEGGHDALEDEVRTQLRLAQRNGARIRWLVNQLLDFAGLETGRMSLDPAEGNLIQVVAKGLRSFEGLAERRDIRLSLEGSLDDPVLRFDDSKLKKVLANLVSEAFRSADEGGTIQVGVHSAPDGDGVELTIENVNANLETGQEERVLNTVRQEDRLWGAEDASAGIGVYLAGKLVNLHGGHVRMSGRVGEGVRFIARLPRQPDGAPSDDASPGADDARVLRDDGPDVLALTRKALSLELEAGEPAPSPVPKGGDVPRGEEDRTTVLVIDDNAVIRTLVRSHLEPDYRVVEGEEGTAGYNLATTLLPDLVITDVMMPEMDGFELCRAIKQDPNIDHIPVIFLTARADSEDKVEGLDVGADAYLTKPFEPEELVARVENLIATRRSLRESFREERADRDAVGTGRDPDPGAENVEVAEEALPSTAERKPLKERIEETILENLTDPGFEVSDLATEVALSASQLRRRMKEMYDYTPVQLIRRRRLEAGARLLRDRPDATIGEVAYAVGFNSQSYFSRSFRDEFGTSPSQYRARHKSMEA